MARQCKAYPGTRCTKETDRAVCVSNARWADDVWIPKSAISDDSDVYGEGHEGKLIVYKWFVTSREDMPKGESYVEE